jgi:hypothetical protein
MDITVRDITSWILQLEILHHGYYSYRYYIMDITVTDITSWILQLQILHHGYYTYRYYIMDNLLQ